MIDQICEPVRLGPELQVDGREERPDELRIGEDLQALLGGALRLDRVGAAGDQKVGVDADGRLDDELSRRLARLDQVGADN